MAHDGTMAHPARASVNGNAVNQTFAARNYANHYAGGWGDLGDVDGCRHQPAIRQSFCR